MRYLDKDALVERIAREEGFEYDDVWKAVDFQFVYLAERIRAGIFDRGVRLPAFGRFAINEKYLEFLRNHVMNVNELQALRASFAKRSPGDVKINRDRLLTVINTAISLHDQLGNENVSPKTELGRKGPITSD
jgi:nucleoid DNA-binding protein